MKPVDQQFLHEPDKGICGDCLRACFASILELPLEQVPHFVQLAVDEEKNPDIKVPQSHWHFIQELLMPYGLAYITVDAKSSGAHWLAHCAGYQVLIGKTVRDPSGKITHAVVGYQGDMVHDPHPSKAGLTEITAFGYFVPLDPAIEQATYFGYSVPLDPAIKEAR